MRVLLARFAFHGNPEASQLSFPAGAQLHAKSNNSQPPTSNGWMWGSYQGNKGWFPINYVTVLSSATDSSKSSAVSTRTAALSATTTSNGTNHPNTWSTHFFHTPPRRIPTIQEAEMPKTEMLVHCTSHRPPISVLEVPAVQSNNSEDDDDAIMGGTPGSLFAPHPTIASLDSSPQRSAPGLVTEQPILQPVPTTEDNYRHATLAPKPNYRNEYTPTVEIRVETKQEQGTMPPSALTPISSRDNHIPDYESQEFWHDHPPRGTAGLTSVIDDPFNPFNLEANDRFLNDHKNGQYNYKSSQSNWAKQRWNGTQQWTESSANKMQGTTLPLLKAETKLIAAKSAQGWQALSSKSKDAFQSVSRTVNDRWHWER